MKKRRPSLIAFAIAVAFASTAHANILYFAGALNAAEVVSDPASMSTGYGYAWVAVDTDLFTITTDAEWFGLSGLVDRSHMHDGPEGQSTNDPPNGLFFHEVLDLTDSPSPYRTVPCDWPDTYTNCAPATGVLHDVLQLAVDNGYGYADFATLVDALLSGGLYMDIHTQLYQDGELRGQLEQVPEPAPVSMVMLGLAFLARKRIVSALRRVRRNTGGPGPA